MQDFAATSFSEQKEVAMPVRRFAFSLVAALATLVTAGSSQPAAAGPPSGFRVEIILDGRPACQYLSGGTHYVEALKGKEYTIRLHNPLDVRVAVALSVDGLNTIDARHTDPREARKWVLDPHETVTISGWQVNSEQARRFFFTSEERSYAQRLGQPDNVGIISAVFFRERRARVIPLGMAEGANPKTKAERDAAPPPAPRPDTASAPQRLGQESRSERHEAADATQAEEYAATGIGDRTRHPVRQVHLDLEDAPAATFDVRYEYRSQLVRLGIRPEAGGEKVLARRERAHGFSGSFCPDVK